MSRIDLALAGVDDVLADVDADGITAALAAGEPDVDRIEQLPVCDWCGHEWHGLPCQPDTLAAEIYEAEMGAAPSWSCRCDSSTVPLDDTWRPIGGAVTPMAKGLAEGMDGYAAWGLYDLARRRRARKAAEQRAAAAQRRAKWEAMTPEEREAAATATFSAVADACGSVAEALRLAGAAAQDTLRALSRAFVSGAQPPGSPYRVFRPLPEGAQPHHVHVHVSPRRASRGMVPGYVIFDESWVAYGHERPGWQLFLLTPGDMPYTPTWDPPEDTPPGLVYDHPIGPETPRDYALRLRRARHTGPSTDVVRQHRPRRHT